MAWILKKLALLFALLGSATALVVAAMTVVSIIGRNFASKPIQGDVELTQFGIALCISLCLPWCQWVRANIIVDFFTQKLPASANARLDAMGTLLLGTMCALLSWRTAVGGWSVYQAGETSMILSLPMWWAYVSLAPGLALAAVIALYQTVFLMLGRNPDPEAMRELSVESNALDGGGQAAGTAGTPNTAEAAR